MIKEVCPCLQAVPCCFFIASCLQLGCFSSGLCALALSLSLNLQKYVYIYIYIFFSYMVKFTEGEFICFAKRSTKQNILVFEYGKDIYLFILFGVGLAFLKEV